MNMRTLEKWEYDEFKQVGVDFKDEREVQNYDERVAKFRDTVEQNQLILQALELKREHVLIDIGAGTGDFSIEAAKRCKHVFAVDVSPIMLKYAKNKAAAKKVNNITFIHAGFLSYVHAGEPVDAIVSNIALHHLPDFWKMVALQRVSQMLKNSGKLYLADTVYNFPVEEHKSRFNNWLDRLGSTAGPRAAQQVQAHIRSEYSTLDWIMEGMLKCAGFKINKVDYYNGIFAQYLCTKVPQKP